MRKENMSLRKITRETKNFTKRDLEKFNYFLELKKKTIPEKWHFEKAMWKTLVETTRKGISTRCAADMIGDISHVTVWLWRNTLIDEFKSMKTKIKVAEKKPAVTVAVKKSDKKNCKKSCKTCKGSHRK